MANENYPIIVGGLKKVGNFFIKELRYELKEQEHIATGKLYDSFYSDIYEYSSYDFANPVSKEHSCSIRYN